MAATLGDGALEVALHEVADGVELHADFFDLMRGGEALAGKGSQNSSGDGSFQKGSAVHAEIVHRIAQAGAKQERPEKIGALLLGGSHSAFAGRALWRYVGVRTESANQTA